MQAKHSGRFQMKATRCIGAFYLAAGVLSLARLPVSAQAQEAPPKAAKKGNGLRGPAQKELIYVTLPGSL